MEHVDITIIGAGVIGLAVAACVARHDRTVFIIERNESFGQEASSRNSEVIHAGIYYPAGSLKAHTCVAGRYLLYELCDLQSIPYKKTGKLIVARDTAEASQLEALYAKGQANGVDDLYLIEARELHKIEPHVAGIAALVSPSTGIIDSHRLMQVLLAHSKAQGGDVVYNTEFLKAEKKTNNYRLHCRDTRGAEAYFMSRVIINCAGLNADVVAERLGFAQAASEYQVHYCKGEYFRINTEKARLISHLIYPVPDAVSLGIHLTPDLAGGVRIGPNAVYVDRNSFDYDVSEAKRDEFFKAAQALLPALEPDDISPDTAGVRAKLQGPRDPVKDFVIQHEIERGLPGIISVLGIESPGLTASVAIGACVSEIVDEILK